MARRQRGTPASSAALVVQTARRDPLVDEAVQEIHRIWSSGVRDTVVRVGQYLIKTFYGSLEAARSQAPGKEASLRALLERADELPVSAHALKMAVRVALQVRELPRDTALALSATHHEKLLAVRDPEVRLQLAEEAATRQLTAGDLAARVRQVQPPHAGGRRRRSPLERGLASIVRALAAQDIADGLTPAALRALDRAQVESLDIQARRARELLEQISDAIARRLRG